MKKRFLLLFLLLSGLMLAACNDEAEDEPTDVPTDAPTEVPDDYPAPATVSPPTLPAGYPIPPTPLPALDPYPDGTVWVVRPAGEQCADELTYPDLASATQELEDEGVTVLAAEEVELSVCSACGCPTSSHYRVQLDPADLECALSLGWQRE